MIKNRNQKIGIDSKIIVKFKDKISQEIVFERYGYEVVRQIGSKTFVLKMPNTNEAIEVANMLNESGVVMYAQPNIYRKAKMR
jgi:hypothetical protein